MQQTKRLSLRVLGFLVPAFVPTDTAVLVVTDCVDESLIGVLRRHPRVGVEDVVYRSCLLGSRVVRESQEPLQTQAGNCTDVFWFKLSGRRQTSAVGVENNAHTGKHSTDDIHQFLHALVSWWAKRGQNYQHIFGVGICQHALLNEAFQEINEVLEIGGQVSITGVVGQVSITGVVGQVSITGVVGQVSITGVVGQSTPRIMLGTTYSGLPERWWAVRGPVLRVSPSGSPGSPQLSEIVSGILNGIGHYLLMVFRVVIGRGLNVSFTVYLG
jgi:hypothetical protein